MKRKSESSRVRRTERAAADAAALSRASDEILVLVCSGAGDLRTRRDNLALVRNSVRKYTYEKKLLAFKYVTDSKNTYEERV